MSSDRTHSPNKLHSYDEQFIKHRRDVSPKEVQRHLAKSRENRWRKKEEQICAWFPPRFQPMTPEYVHGNDGQEAVGLPQRDKERDEVKPGPSKLAEQKPEAEVQVLKEEKLAEQKLEAETQTWRENKQKIDAQYQCAPRDWDGW